MPTSDALGNRGSRGDGAARCGGNGDVRRPGDGVVAYTPDDDNTLNGSVPSHDKNYMTAGPRPAEVTPTCFAPISKTPIPAGQPGCPTDSIGPDRLYVTWTIFFQGTATINFSYSDDRAYSWSPPKAIGGSAPFCVGGAATGDCDDNQGSVPTVNPTTGELWVAFENFNTPDENQYLVVRSVDGGQTFQGPFFVSTVFDVNYPPLGSEPDGLHHARPGKAQRAHELVLPRQLVRQHRRGPARWCVRGRPLPRPRRQPQRLTPELERRRLLLHLEGRRADLDRADPGERRPVAGPGRHDRGRA